MRYNIATILIMFLSLSSCNEFKKGNGDGLKEAQEEQGPEETMKDSPSVKMYVLDGGTVQVNELSIFTQDDKYKGESREFADAIYIIEHPNGRILWDAGLAESLVGQEPFTTPNGAFTVSRKDSIVNQLKTIDLTPADFEYIALSHTHFDHSGSAYQFKDATWLVQESEYNFVTSDEIKTSQPDMYNAIKDLKNVKKLKGEFDVFGDGKVIIKSMPGHTPGHQVLYVELEKAGPILLTGDLYHFEENRTNRGVPSFNANVDNTLESMDEFEAFAKEKNAKVIIQHSKKDFDALPKYPEAIN